MGPGKIRVRKTEGFMMVSKILRMAFAEPIIYNQVQSFNVTCSRFEKALIMIMKSPFFPEVS